MSNHYKIKILVNQSISSGLSVQIPAWVGGLTRNSRQICNLIQIAFNMLENKYICEEYLILMSAAAFGDTPPDAAANFFSLKCHKTL